MAHTRNKANRYSELLTAAREVFAEKGFEAATISEIVARVGVAQGTFYLYFQSKYALISALSREMSGSIIEAIREIDVKSSSVAELIDACVHVAFKLLGEYQDVLNVIIFGINMPNAETEREHFFSSYDTFISELVKRTQERGGIDPEVNPVIAGKLIVGLVYHAAYECYMNNSKIAPHEYAEETARFIRSALKVV